MACGEKLALRKKGLRTRRKKEWARVEWAEPNQIWQSDMTKIWAGPEVNIGQRIQNSANSPGLLF
jgi:hypothetical protein